MNLLLVLGLVLASAMALPTKNKPPVRKPHHDAHRVGHHHDVKGLIKGVLNSKIKGLINEPLIPWIQSNTLDSFKGKMRQLKQKNAGKVKSRRQGKIPEFKNIFGWTNEKDDKEAPRIEDLVDPDLADILYGGDILLNPDQVDALLAESDTRKKRQATTVWNKWTNPVNYYFDPVAGYTDAQKTIMRNAFKVWDDNTCINFAETSTPANKIKVTNTLGSGCYATLGMQSNGQVMSLPGGCINPGTAAHEMCHALGVFHHQARSDRDNYIYVNTSNILSDDESQAQYDKLSTSESNNFNTLYDYGSVMHYSDSGFTNGNGPTMLALNPMHQKTMGQRDGPSFIDILLVNRFYNCLGTCASLACQNGGYPNPANCAKCICPSGFSGTLCDQRPASTNTAACTGSTLTATTSFQTLTVSLDREFEEGLTTDSCTYWINSPAGTQIEIQFVQMEKYASCGLTSLEVKAEDMTLTGYKICPTANGVQSLSNIPVIKSTTNKVILTLRNAWGTFNTNLKYRYVAGTGGATQPPATTTTTTEAPTGGCTDIDTDCDYFNSQGYCSTDSIYYQWMTENCAQTCDTCNTCTNDADDADCDAWAANGDCDWDQFMWDYCKKSCNLC